MSSIEGPELWQVRFPIPADAVDEVLTVIDDDAASLAAYETDPGVWLCEVMTRARPDVDALMEALGAVLGGDAPAPSAVVVEPVAAKDWLEATRRSFPPLEVGRFWVHGSHVEEPPPKDRIPLMIDAATAFGSGEHPSTKGCLSAIDRLARRRRFRRVLDIGCGSAILAIAALKCWPTASGCAADIDDDAVTAARSNARTNGVAVRLRAFTADGYAHPELRRAGRFDLVLANILAGPLVEMAGALAHTLAVGGHAVLAGLVAIQAEAVRVAHRHHGLVLVARHDLGPWTTLVLHKPRRTRARPRIVYPSPFGMERWSSAAS